MKIQALALIMLIATFAFMSFACGDDDDGNDDSADDDTTGDDDLDDDVNDDLNDDLNDDVDDDTAEAPAGPFLDFNLNPDEKNVPFPSHLYLAEDNGSPTGLRINMEGSVSAYIDEIMGAVGFILHDLNKVDGFSTAAPVWFPVSEAPKQNQFPDHLNPSADDSVFCVVLEDESHPHHGEFYPLDVDYLRDWKLIQAYPYKPFYENTDYACVVKTGLQTKTGEDYVASDHFRYIISDQADANHEDYEILEPVRQKYAPYFQELFDQYGLNSEDILSATFFHTQWTTHDLLCMREFLEDLAVADPPQVGDWEQISFNHENVDSVWETTYETPGWFYDGKLMYDASGDPVIGDDMSVTLRLTIPKAGINGYEPPNPVAIFGHGINASRTQAGHVAEQFAGWGIATVAIDWLYHGERVQNTQGLPDWLISVVQSIQYINVIEPIKMRDNFKQGVSDMVWLKHVIRSLSELDLAPYATEGDLQSDLDTEHIYYTGMSLGSIHGGIIAAMEPDLDGYLLNTGASDWKSIAIDGAVSEYISAISWILDILIPYPVRDDLDISLELFRQMAGAGDPYEYSRYVIDEPVIGEPRPNLLHQMAAYDETLGGPGSAKMAWSMDLTLLNPYVFMVDEMNVADAPFFGPASYQYDIGDHNFFVHNSDVFAEAHMQAGTFLRSIYETGVGEIIDPFAD